MHCRCYIFGRYRRVRASRQNFRHLYTIYYYAYTTDTAKRRPKLQGRSSRPICFVREFVYKNIRITLYNDNRSTAKHCKVICGLHTLILFPSTRSVNTYMCVMYCTLLLHYYYNTRYTQTLRALVRDIFLRCNYINIFLRLKIPIT